MTRCGVIDAPPLLRLRQGNVLGDGGRHQAVRVRAVEYHPRARAPPTARTNARPHDCWCAGRGGGTHTRTHTHAHTHTHTHTSTHKHTHTHTHTQAHTRIRTHLHTYTDTRTHTRTRTHTTTRVSPRSTPNSVGAGVHSVSDASPNVHRSLSVAARMRALVAESLKVVVTTATPSCTSRGGATARPLAHLLCAARAVQVSRGCASTRGATCGSTSLLDSQ